MEEGSRHSRSLRLVKGCETWFSRASMRSLSDLLVLPGILSLMRPGILSLILERHPLPPPPLLLLLPLSLAPPGCHPPFAMFRSPDIVCGLCHVSTLALDSVALDLHAPLTSATISPSVHHIVESDVQSTIHSRLTIQCLFSFSNPSYHYAVRQLGDISNRQCKLQDAVQSPFTHLSPCSNPPRSSCDRLSTLNQTRHASTCRHA